SHTGRIVLRSKVHRSVPKNMLGPTWRSEGAKIAIGVVTVLNGAAVRKRLLDQSPGTVVLVANRSIERIRHRFQIAVVVVGEGGSPALAACSVRRAGQPAPVIVDKADGLNTCYLRLGDSAQDIEVQRGLSSYRGCANKRPRDRVESAGVVAAVDCHCLAH